MSETSDRETATKPRGSATAKSDPDRLPALPDASVFTFGPVAAKVAPFNEAAATPLKSEVPRPSTIGMFETLVSSDGDVMGLVAYGIYKHSKRDWLVAFAKVHGRPPDAKELQNFMLGEATERRTATYRHLAENLVAAVSSQRSGTSGEKKPSATSESTVGFPKEARQARRRFPMLQTRSRHDEGQGRLWVLGIYVGILMLFLIGLAFLVRNGSFLVQ